MGGAIGSLSFFSPDTYYPHDVVKDVLPGDFAQSVFKRPDRCLAAAQGAWAGAKEPPHPGKGVWCCPVWDDCLIIRHPSRLGRGALITVLKSDERIKTSRCCAPSRIAF